MDETNDKKTENGINKPKNGKPKFSFYWIYALLALLIIGLQFMNNWGTSPKSVGWGEVKIMTQNQDIERLVLVNKEFAEIYIQKDKLKLEKYKEVRPGEGFGAERPQYIYTIGSVETFEKDFSELQQGLEKPVYIENLTRRNVWGDALSWILPVLLLVGAWFFIMRMMSRGSGGGGQIFNIGHE